MSEFPQAMLPTRLIRTEWPPTDGVRPGNPQFDALFDSIQEDGIREPLTINLGWFLIDGNHRLSAARLLGIELVPVRVWTGVEFLPPVAPSSKQVAQPADSWRDTGNRGSTEHAARRRAQPAEEQ